MNDLVVRLHNALLDALRQRASRLDQPVTVAEIYQDLIPYRMVRSFGFALNADYEFALLQLLAGEGKLARIEPPEVREELRLELLSPNPNVGMFRQYAACDVFVNGPGEAIDAKPNETEQKRTETAARPHVPNDWLLNTKEEKSGGNGQDRSLAQPTESKSALKRAETGPPVESKAAKTSASPAAPKQSVRKERAASGAESGAKPRAQTITCASCARSLPAGRAARFCPYCGAEQMPQCPSCGEALDRSWGFCISCGTRVQ
jgi:Double zinc ribbon